MLLTRDCGYFFFSVKFSWPQEPLFKLKTNVTKHLVHLELMCFVSSINKSKTSLKFAH